MEGLTFFRDSTYLLLFFWAQHYFLSGNQLTEKRSLEPNLPIPFKKWVYYRIVIRRHFFLEWDFYRLNVNTTLAYIHFWYFFYINYKHFQYTVEYPWNIPLKSNSCFSNIDNLYVTWRIRYCKKKNDILLRDMWIRYTLSVNIILTYTHQCWWKL